MLRKKVSAKKCHPRKAPKRCASCKKGQRTFNTFGCPKHTGNRFGSQKSLNFASARTDK